jgi:hypothetical protein
MNDRIRKLYQQAHSIRHHDGDPMRDGDPPTVYWQGEVSAKKFAELIVQECAKVILETPVKYTEIDIMHIIRDNVKEHFGVEE